MIATMGYVVACDHYEDGDTHIGELDPKVMSAAQMALDLCRPLGKKWPKEAQVKYSAAEAVPLGALRKDAAANSFGWLIVNQHYKDLLANNAPGAFEMLRVQLSIAPKKLVKTGWWIANVLAQREAVDREKSVWKPDAAPGKMRTISKLVMCGSVDKSWPWAFRLAEMPSVIMVREEVAAAAKRAKLTGLQFVEPAKFQTLG
jgi:hypothetical protein